MTTLKVSILAMTVGMVFLMTMACSMKYGQFIPSTKFAYPNSNVEPLGHVEGASTSLGFFGAPPVSKEMMDEAMNNALQQKGADMLIDFKMQSQTLTIPPLPIGWTTLTVSGTAAKTTIGKQELR